MSVPTTPTPPYAVPHVQWQPYLTFLHNTPGLQKLQKQTCSNSFHWFTKLPKIMNISYVPQFLFMNNLIKTRYIILRRLNKWEILNSWVDVFTSEKMHNVVSCFTSFNLYVVTINSKKYITSILSVSQLSRSDTKYVPLSFSSI